jgi:hypothetical protein
MLFYLSMLEFMNSVSHVLIRKDHLRFCLCIIVDLLARVKSTARPMTTKELAVASIPPVEQEIQEPEIAQPPEDNTAPAVRGSENHEEGEIRSEGEDIGDVDVDPKDLIATKCTKSLTPTT